MHKPAASHWIASCAARLDERWHTVPASDLKAAAVEVWREEAIQEHRPDESATRWFSELGDD